MCFKISDFGINNFLKENRINKISSNRISPDILKGEKNLISNKRLLFLSDFIKIIIISRKLNN